MQAQLTGAGSVLLFVCYSCSRRFQTEMEADEHIQIRVELYKLVSSSRYPPTQVQE